MCVVITRIILQYLICVHVLTCLFRFHNHAETWIANQGQIQGMVIAPFPNYIREAKRNGIKTLKCTIPDKIAHAFYGPGLHLPHPYSIKVEFLVFTKHTCVCSKYSITNDFKNKTPYSSWGLYPQTLPCFKDPLIFF